MASLRYTIIMLMIVSTLIILSDISHVRSNYTFRQLKNYRRAAIQKLLKEINELRIYDKPYENPSDSKPGLDRGRDFSTIDVDQSTRNQMIRDEVRSEALSKTTGCNPDALEYTNIKVRRKRCLDYWLEELEKLKLAQ